MLTCITDGVWTVRQRFTAPGMDLPLTMTILRLEDGGLLLYSPVPMTGDVPDRIRELGEVQHILGPSKLHHLHIDKAQALFPHARSWGAPGLPDKRQDLKLTELPRDSPFAGVEVVHIDGAPMLNEVCLHHAAGDTTVVCDLAFNMQDVKGWFGQVFTWMTGTNDGLAMSRSWRMFSRERAATVASIDRLLSFGAQRVVMGHGEPVLDGGAQQLRDVIFLK